MTDKQNQITEELQSIQKRTGLLMPEDVVRFAKDKRTALHGEFEWDDTKAAHEHRLLQARQIINVAVTVIPNTEREVRAFVSLASDRIKNGGYRSTIAVLSDEDRKAELLAQARAELASWAARYEEFRELAGVIAKVRSALKRTG